MSDYDDACTPELIEDLKSSLEEALEELNNIGNVSSKEIGKNLAEINENISFYCLTYLGSKNDSAAYLSGQLRPAAAQMSRAGVTANAKKCIPHIENLLDYLENEYEAPEEEEEEEEEEEVGDDDDGYETDKTEKLYGGKRKIGTKKRRLSKRKNSKKKHSKKRRTIRRKNRGKSCKRRRCKKY
jgi:hypothetical protein